jgi:hypothetical protein
MVTYKQLTAENPIKFFWSIYQYVVYLIILLAERLLLPTACRAVTLRTQIVRCIYGSFLANFWDILFKAPPNLREEDYKSEKIGGVPSVVIPRHASLSSSFSKPSTSLILLYGHGGGFYFGEPLMYISTYKRWIKEAKEKGVELIIVSVDYRRSIGMIRCVKLWCIESDGTNRTFKQIQISCMSRRLPLGLLPLN